MADHRITINIDLTGKENIDALKQLATVIDQFHGKTTINIRPNVDMSGINRLISGLNTAATLTNSISSGFQGLSNFAGGIGQSFKQMSNMFNTDLVKYAAQSIVNSTMSLISGSVDDIISRYDILSTFTPYMQIAGVDKTTANAALQRVNQSILGLPIGLDEAAYRLRRYQMFVGDTEQATNLTIGLQNALTAGGASESMRNTAYMEMERLLTSGDLATWRQWQALITGFGVSSKFLADAISEITGQRVKVTDLARGLHEGTISADDLLKSLEYLGQDWSKIPDSKVPQFVKDMNSALDVYKGTIEAWESNIKFAVTRGGANLLDVLDESMKEQQGTGVIDVLSNLRDLINDIFGAGSTFVQEHPEGIQTAFNIVGGLLERFQAFDWELFSTNVITNLGTLFDLIFSAFDRIPPGKLEEFASFAITIAGPLGTLFEAVQGGFPMLLGVFERFKEFDFNMLIDDILTEVNKMADLVERVLNIFTDEQLSKLLSIGLVWGTPLAKFFSSLSQGLTGLAIALRGFEGLPTLADILGPLVSGATTVETLLPGVLGTLGFGALLVGSLGYVDWAVDYEAQKKSDRLSALAQLNHDNAIGSTMDYIAGAQAMRESLESQKIEWDAAEKQVDFQSESTIALVEKIRDTNNRLTSTNLSPRLLKRLQADLQESIGEWQDMFPELALGTTEGRGALDEGSAFFINEMADNYTKLLDAQQRLEVYYNARKTIQGNIATGETQREVLASRLKQEKAYQQDIATELDRTTKQMDNWNDASQEYSYGKRQKNLEELREKVDELNESYNYTDQQIKATEDELANLDSYLENNRNLLEEYNVSIDDAAKIVSNLSNATYEINGQAVAWKDLTEAQQEYVSQYETIRSQVLENIQSQLDNYDKLPDVPNSGTFVQAVEGLTDQNEKLTYFNNIADETAGLLANLSETNPELFERLSGPIGELLQVVGGDFSERGLLYGLNEALKGDLGDLEEFVTQAEEKIAGEDGVASKLANLYELVTGGQDYLQTGVEHPELFPGLADSLANMQELAGVDLSGFGSSAGDAAKEVEPFAEAVGATSEHALEAKKNLDEAKTSIGNAGSTAANKSGQMEKFAGAVSAVSSAASAAAIMVAALARAIAGLQDKVVNIRVNQSGGVFTPGTYTSKYQETYAEGGWSGTGPLSMGPHGSDTIPAWLSPGEFVVKRSAAKLFGPTFLEKVNGMDINGAFDALMHNLARPGGMYMPNVSYTRDNHANVNINNYGETGQGYSQKKAYRWASTL